MLHEDTLATSVLRPTYVTIDLNVLTENYHTITRHAADQKVIFILKANAYGHGLIKIAQHLEGLGAYYFGVAYLEEGIMLREAGVKTSILVLGGIIGNQIPLFIKHDLTITASSIEKLKQIEQTAQSMGKKAIAHLKIDTGMERIGMHYYSAEALLEESLKCKHTLIEGIFTHFANADEEDDSYTLLQVSRFESILAFYNKRNLTRPFVHMSNSGAMLQLKDTACDMIRVGILLYGIYPAPHLKLLIDVSPVLSWQTHVVFFKVVKPDHPVSYGGAWSSDHNTRVVTLPLGYGDGYMRAMSNKAKVLIRGRKYDQVGNICMDQMMVNLEDGTAYNGDEVVLIGRQGDEEIRIEDLASWAGTIPYEIMTIINTRVPRVYIDNAPSMLS